MRALFIVTGSDQATWLSEVTHPYWHLAERGVEIDIVTPEGNKIVWDPLSDPSTEGSAEPDDLVSKGFLSDRTLVAKLHSTSKLRDAELDSYDAVHVAGGLGAVFDLYPNKDVARVLEHFWAHGKIIGAICHGVVALANNPERIRGRPLTAYTIAEDDELRPRLGSGFVMPHYPQQVLEEVGAAFKSVAPHEVCVVRDGQLVTGQNQQSASDYGLTLFHAMAGLDPVLTF